MNEFDYFGNFLVGQYLPLDTAVHRLDPRAKILAITLLLAAVTAAPGILGLLLAIGLLLVALAVARVSLRYPLRSLLATLPLLLILAVLRVFFYPQAAGPPLLALGPLAVTETGLASAAVLLLRFAAYVGALSLASYVTSPSELTHGLEALLRPLARLHLPVSDFVLVIQITLRFFPALLQTAERIAKAQASRGADWGSGQGGLVRRVKLVIPLIVPLFLISLRRAENLALAMDARGYSGKARRTSMLELGWRTADSVALAAVVATAAMIILL